MGQHYLRMLFSPKSVAVIGASQRANAVGEIVFRNILESGYTGLLYPVNPAHQQVQGQHAYATIEEIGSPVELAVICTEAETVPDIIEACGKHGVRAAVVLSAGFSEVGAQGAALEHAMLANAKNYGVRIIGPNCLGIVRTSDRAQRHVFQRPHQVRQPRAGFSVGGAVHGNSRLGTGQRHRLFQCGFDGRRIRRGFWRNSRLPRDGRADQQYSDLRRRHPQSAWLHECIARRRA